MLVRGGFKACLTALKDTKGNQGSDLLWFVGWDKMGFDTN